MPVHAIIDVMSLAFFINAPIQIIITLGQWLLMARFIAPANKTIADVLFCLLLSYVTAYFLALLIWLFWPLASELIMYRNRISIPAVLGEIIAIPFWLNYFGYFKSRKL